MAELYYQRSGQTTPLADELTDSLQRSLKIFFADTMGIDAQYLTRAAIDHVDGMRKIESDRTQSSGLNRLAGLLLIRHVGKIMNFLPDAITDTLKEVEFDPEASPRRGLHEDEAEFELDDKEPDERSPQGLPSSGTPPGPPPPLNPGEMPPTSYRWQRRILNGLSKESMQYQTIDFGGCSHDECVLAISLRYGSNLRAPRKELWCQQWHMYKRDMAIGNCYGTLPAADVRYDKVCA